MDNKNKGLIIPVALLLAMAVTKEVQMINTNKLTVIHRTLDKKKLPQLKFKLKEKHFYTAREIARSIRDYLPEREQIYADMYINGVNLYDCYKRLKRVNSTKIQTIVDVAEERRKRIEMLRAVKPYLPEDKQKGMDFVLNATELADALVSNWNSYMQQVREINENKDFSQIEKIVKIIELFKPMIRSDTDKIDIILKQLKMFDLVLKAEAMLNDKSSKSQDSRKDMMRGKEDSDGKEKFLSNVRSLLNEQQQKAFDKVVEFLKESSKPNTDQSKEKTEIDNKNEVIEVKPIEVKDNGNNTKENKEI